MSVSADSGGTYIIATGRPVPEIARTDKYNETWNICKAPKPQNSTQNTTEPGGGVIDIGMQGQFDPSKPTTLDGTTTWRRSRLAGTLKGNVVSATTCWRG